MREPGQRRPRALGAVFLAVVAVLVLASLGATSSWGTLVSILPAPPRTFSPPPPPTPSAPSSSAEPPLLPDIEPAPMPDWVGQLLVVLAAVGAAVLVAWFVVLLTRALQAPDRRRAAAASGTAVEVPVIDEEAVSLSLEETLIRLRSGVAVDDAVVACWRRLEQIAADSGIVRGASQTTSEFTVEILAHAIVDAQALADLAGLYRQAVFSTHVLTDTDRDTAIASIERLAAQLGAPR